MTETASIYIECENWEEEEPKVHELLEHVTGHVDTIMNYAHRYRPSTGSLIFDTVRVEPEGQLFLISHIDLQYLVANVSKELKCLEHKIETHAQQYNSNDGSGSVDQ